MKGFYKKRYVKIKEWWAFLKWISINKVLKGVSMNKFNDLVISLWLKFHEFEKNNKEDNDIEEIKEKLMKKELKKLINNHHKLMLKKDKIEDEIYENTNLIKKIEKSLNI